MLNGVVHNGLFGHTIGNRHVEMLQHFYMTVAVAQLGDSMLLVVIL